MSTQLSSAGLLYVYLNGYEEDGVLYLQQTDSYRFICDELYSKIMEEAKLADEDEDIVHIFAVVGLKEKANYVFSTIENELKMNYHRMLSNNKIKPNTQDLDSVGNILFRCVQEFYCEQLNHFPKRIYCDYGDIVFCGIYCSHMPDETGSMIANAMVSLWCEREKPMLCGWQLMTRSFFMRDFVDRKVVATLPDTESGYWRLVFEGGHQLYLSENMPYIKETLHPNDLGGFCLSNIQSVLLNPIYAFGKWYQPNDICEEWHKVFLYLCAISDMEWDCTSICEVYRQFLCFLEENICLTTDAAPMFSREEYYEVLLTHINRFRDFLKGEDEPVISKDLHQTLNSRYVYLPYLWSFIDPSFSQQSFSSSELKELVDRSLRETDTHTKGIIWEDTAAYVLNNVVGWKITGRRIKAGAQEIDLSIANVSLDDELYILIECKNWTSHVDIHEIRNIAHISNMKGNKTAILFAANGITSDAQAEIYRLVTSNISIICVTANDLKQLTSAYDCKSLILSQWLKLHSNDELAIDILI